MSKKITKKPVQKKTAKKQTIMGRSAEVTISYDFKKDGKIERRQKHFKDAKEAKKFFVEKDKLGKKPAVMSAPNDKKTDAAVMAMIQARTDRMMENKKPYEEMTFRERVKSLNGNKPTLSELYPDEVKEPKRTLIPTGDPSKTEFEGGDAMKDEKKLKEEAKKQAKRLRRKQKKGELLWKNKDTKTIVSVKFQLPCKEATYPRWHIRFDDNTEDIIYGLTVVYSRDHTDHHLRSPVDTYIDGLSNKDYERVLWQCFENARKAATKLGASLHNFKGSEKVQKEMEKRISKKAMKAEAFTPEDIELAKKIADLANLHCLSPNYFFMAEEQLKKCVHCRYSKEQIGQILSNAAIDLHKATIPIMQLANRYFKTMTPRLEPGGPQIATPELVKEYEDKQSARAREIRDLEKQEKRANKETRREQRRAEKLAEKEARKAEKLEARSGKKTSSSKPVVTGEGRDNFGSKLGTNRAAINAALTNTPQTYEQISKRSKIKRCRLQLENLIERGFVEETKKGFALTEKGIKAQSGKESKASKKDQKVTAVKMTGCQNDSSERASPGSRIRRKSSAILSTKTGISSSAGPGKKRSKAAKIRSKRR